MSFPFSIRPIFLLLTLIARGSSALAEGPFLLNAQQASYATRPDYIRDHFAYIDKLPFDGSVISSATGRTIMDGAVHGEAAMTIEFAPLNGLGFSRMKRNFALVTVDRPADFFGDWSVTIENFRAFARVLRAHGLVGIFFDNEEYSRTLFNYPEDCDEPARSVAEYQAQARLRGREIMEAMSGEFPGLVVLVAHGPYSSFAGTPAAVRAGQTDWQTEELRGAFSAGLIEGMDSRGSFIDGGELYSYRSALDFQASFDFRKTTLAAPETGCPFIPDYLRDVWARKVGIAYGVYNLPHLGRSMNPLILRSTLSEALRHSDSYVWLYFEGENWNAPGELSPGWMEAVLGAAAVAPPPIVPVGSPPWVGLSSPSEGAVFRANSSIAIAADAVDADAEISKVEFFDHTTKLGEATAAPFGFVWSNASVGTHRLTATATSADGVVGVSGEVRVLVSARLTAAINFQPPDATAPPGYFADVGMTYENRGNGLEYGWNVNHASGMRLRADAVELRRATLCQMRSGGVWEIGVAPGSYRVTVGIGDSSYGSSHTVNVEGVSYWRARLLQPAEFAEKTLTIAATDGRITIDQGTAAFEATRIDYVLVAAADAVPAPPGALTAWPASAGAIELSWSDNSSTESSFVLERSTVPDFSRDVTIVTLLPGVSKHRDQGLLPGTRYFYRIRATSGAGDSAYSNVPSAAAPLLDLDGDGIADAFEFAPCIVGVDDQQADDDGDGFSNAVENVAGTDGRQGSSFPRLALRVTPSSAGAKTVGLGFPTQWGWRYGVEFTDFIPAGVWTMCEGFPVVGDGNWLWEFQTTTARSRVYRLRIYP